ncbi:DUF6134 family protein [Tenacibaculum amylolyticum]|uniref:DUF6134 family protein n=1 Tax=Tenacibaculum amylolyticum TaxID=104269 RepID=UPI003895482F
MRKQSIIICAILFCCAKLIGQTYEYDVLVFGKKIGTVIAQRTVEGDEVTYTSNSKSEVSFFGKKTILTKMKTIYKNDILNYSFYEVKKNGKIKEKSVINSKNGNYIIDTDGKTTVHDAPVKLSTIMLTYYKPKNGDKVFEEVGGYYKEIKQVNANTFDLISPESRHKDSYIYNEVGVLEQCIVRKTLFNFKMILRDTESLTAKK